MALTVEALKGLYEKLGGTDFGNVTTIPEAIDKVTEVAEAGGGDTYETVAEIEVGQMEQPQEMFGFYVYNESDASAPTLVNDETYYFNDSETSSTLVDVGVETVTLRFNASTGEGLPTRVNPNKPLYVIQWNIDNGTLLVVSDANEVENTTVRILKKVSGGGSSITVDDKLKAGSTNPVENGAIYDEFEDVYAKIQRATPLIVHGTADYLQRTATLPDSITLAEIYSAAAAGRYVAFECSLEAGNTTRLTLAEYTEANDEYTIVFAAAAEQNRFPAVVSAEFENSLHGTFIYAVPDANP